MKVQGTTQPEPVEIKRQEMGKAIVILRNNITEKQREDENGISTYYEWDQVEVTMPLHQGLKSDIENNFEDFWDKETIEGLKNMKGRIGEVEKATGAGDKAGERGIAKRIDELEDRIAKLEG